MKIMLEVEAKAKINPLLYIIGRFDNAYHCIFTLIVPIDFADKLSIDIGPGTGQQNLTVKYSQQLKTHIDAWLKVEPALAQQALDSLNSKQNLALRAANDFFNAASDHNIDELDINLVLEKHVPLCAGLGGGSADAAALLSALSKQFPEQVSVKSINEIALNLGADVSALLQSKPIIAHGVGEQLIEFDSFDRQLSLLGLKLLGEFSAIVILKPVNSSNTKLAYQQFSSQVAELPTFSLANYRQASHFMIEQGLQKRGLKRNPSRLSEFVYNDFDSGFLDCTEQVRQAHRALVACGAEASLLAGSGSSVVGFFANAEQAQFASVKLEQELSSDWFIKTCKLSL